MRCTINPFALLSKIYAFVCLPLPLFIKFLLLRWTFFKTDYNEAGEIDALYIPLTLLYFCHHKMCICLFVCLLCLFVCCVCLFASCNCFQQPGNVF